jgi:protein-tyrosine-phosphatase
MMHPGIIEIIRLRKIDPRGYRAKQVDGLWLIREIRFDIVVALLQQDEQ